MFWWKYQALGNFGVAAIQNDAATIIDDILHQKTEAPTRCPGSKSFSATPGLPDGRATKESKDASWSLDTLSHVKQIGRLWPKY